MMLNLFSAPSWFCARQQVYGVFPNRDPTITGRWINAADSIENTSSILTMIH